MDENAEKLIALIRLAARQSLSVYQRQQLNALLSHYRLGDFDREVIAGLTELVVLPDISLPLLAPNIALYIIKRYGVLDANPQLSLPDVFRDQLLIRGLATLRFNSLHIERFLNTIREALLILSLRNKALLPDSRELIAALAAHSHSTEYVASQKPSEAELLSQLRHIIAAQLQKNQWQMDKLEAPLLLFTMYHSLWELPAKDQLLASAPEQWPQSLRTLAKSQLYDVQQECEIALTIEALSQVSNTTSKAVQAQYEQNPYPRWSSAYAEALPNFATFIRHLGKFQLQSFPENYDGGKSKILIAGCGTGLQAIKAAMRFPDAHITAIDISLGSLSYGIRKARELNVHNISFYQADLLALDCLTNQFHYIECCGVLHHLHDPLQGWQNLKQCLLPDGVMRISLYSRFARAAILSEREEIAAQRWDTSSNKSIRRYRDHLLADPARADALASWADFYNLSEFRDLLFHVHESTYTWEEVDHALKLLDMKFLGVVDPQGVVLNAYRNTFPENHQQVPGPAMLAKLEAREPGLFRNMYQFLCQK